MLNLSQVNMISKTFALILELLISSYQHMHLAFLPLPDDFIRMFLKYSKWLQEFKRGAFSQEPADK